MLLLILCLLLLNTIISGSDECPSEEQIPKCMCDVEVTGIRLGCGEFDTTNELQNHLKYWKGRKVYQLYIHKFTPGSNALTDLFNGLEIERLILYEVVEVDDAAFGKEKRHFRGLEDSLVQLSMRINFVRGGLLPILKLDHLKKLQYFLLYNTNVPEVGNDWFADGLENLQTLILERNDIEELGDKAFSTLGNLRSLEISGNDLEFISRSQLPKTALKLSKLNLSNNRIRTFPEDIFSGMPSLEHLDLSYNLIHQINYNVFNPIFSQLDYFFLDGNKLQCDDDMKWICEKRLPVRFRGRRNKFDSLPEDFFSQMPNLARVNLELNQFSTIDEKVWNAVWPHLDYLNIDYNPMICDKKIQWIFETEADLDHKVVGTCYKPFNLMDRDIHSLELDELKSTK